MISELFCYEKKKEKEECLVILIFLISQLTCNGAGMRRALRPVYTGDFSHSDACDWVVESQEEHSDSPKSKKRQRGKLGRHFDKAEASGDTSMKN